jgi:UDP-N-acetylmuramoyl-tripeptide--D-alanyl-D-alanine ligase
MNLNIDDLLKITGSKIISADGSNRIRFGGVSIDSRNCRKNDLFIALKGDRYDGHDFVKSVFEKEIKGAIVSRGWYESYRSDISRSFKNKTMIVVDDTLRALGELARNHRDSFIIPVIAVGGSNGKTTVKDLIAYVLSKKYGVQKTPGNYNNAIGVPLTLLGMDKSHEISVIEIGTNHFGEIKYLCGLVKPQFGVLTNIGREHLEFLRDIKGVKKEEFELINYLENNFGTFFLNNDDKYIKERLNRATLKVFSYGNKEGDVIGRILRFEKFNPVVEITYTKVNITVKLKMIGTQSFNSALCAAAFGFYFDVKPEDIKKALSEFTMDMHKRNELKRVNGFWLIDDTYNSNPDSVIAAMENLKKYEVKGNIHIVLSDMLELGNSSRKEHFQIGKLVHDKGFDNLYTYGPGSYETFRGAKGVRNNFYFQDKGTLIEFLKSTINKNDIILIKGSRSMKMEEVTAALENWNDQID